MCETIYNIFYFVDNGTITHAAICIHDVDGTNEEKAKWLKSAVALDLVKATRVPLPKAIPHDTFIAMQRLGRHLEVFDALFEEVGAPCDPFCCITPIVDGCTKIDICTDHEPLTAQVMQSLDTPTLNDVQDWLTKYATENGFDLPRLLDDDYFRAIRLLFNSQQYVSCMKLLVSFIDTVAFLAYGDNSLVFIKWLDTHARLTSLGVTSQELWELRNGLLHMSNLDSRKVVKKDVRRIGFCVAPKGRFVPPDAEITYFNILDLIDAVANGVSHWIKHINANRDEFVHFVERYDRIISDDRQTYIVMPRQGPASDVSKTVEDGIITGTPDG